MAGTKRGPTSDLNHDNWNDEEEPEESGTFSQASEAEISQRKILRPKRKLTAVSLFLFRSISLGFIS